MLDYFIFCIVTGIIAAVVASNKGRSGLLWGLGCFILPILIIFPVFLSVAGEVRGRWQQCQDCAEFVKWNAHKCRYCGADLDDQWEDEEEDAGIKTCPGCGARNRAEDCTCLSCSSPI